MDEILHTEITTISYNEKENLVHIFLKPSDDVNLQFDIHQAKEIVETAKKFVGDSRFLLLFDVRDSFYFPNKEAEKYLSSNKQVIAEAIIIKHLHQRIYGNFFIKLARKNSGYPVKLFTNKEKALAWLDGFRG